MRAAPALRSLAEGRHYGSTGACPLIPGVEAVARTADGVLAYTGYVQAPYGTLAERMAVPAGLRLPLPGGADPAQIAGGLNPGLALWLPLQSRLADTPSLGTVVVLSQWLGAKAVEEHPGSAAHRALGLVTVPGSGWWEAAPHTWECAVYPESAARMQEILTVWLGTVPADRAPRATGGPLSWPPFVTR
jgi:hypothetical protein